MIQQIEPEYVEAFGIHEALRKFGFRSDDIFFSIGISANFGGRCMHIILKTQGKQFIMTVCKIDDDVTDEQVYNRWSEVATLMSSHMISQDEANRMWQQSQMGKNQDDFEALALAIQAKGFFLPGLMS